MRNWLDSIYSDGTVGFVSNPTPELRDEIEISLRLWEESPVKDVLLRRIINGAEQYIDMEVSKIESGLKYYSAKVKINEPKLQYHFVITTEDVVYFYTQAGISTVDTDYKHDFVLLTNYRNPDWVKGAVFYQIFPERFCNGNKDNDVQDGEYTYMGHKCIKMDDWSQPPLSVQDAHGMDFFGGDLEGIIEKIPYLKELGVTAIYLNPIFESYSTHKYDCTDYFHVDKHFGGDEALAALSEELHKNDMKLILDISINHTGIEHKWVHENKPYYFKKEDGSLLGWAGIHTLPVLDYRNEELREIIYKGEDSVLKKWLKPPYNIDGWRFDVADVLAKNDDVQLFEEVWKGVCDSIREVKSDAFIIGEHWADCSEYLQGDLWNTPMNYFGFGRIMRQFAGMPDLFLARNDKIAKVPYRLTAADVVTRTDLHYTVIPQAIADCQMNLFDSHDVDRVHNYEGIGFEKWKSVAISQFFWTGIPCIYYGDEVGIEGHTISDAGCRYPMPWGREKAEGKPYYDVYKKLIDMRKNEPALYEGGRKVLYANNRVLVVARFLDSNKYICVISMDDLERTINIPLWIIGASAFEGDKDVFGSDIAFECQDGEVKLNVPALASYVIKVS